MTTTVSAVTTTVSTVTRPKPKPGTREEWDAREPRVYNYRSRVYDKCETIALADDSEGSPKLTPTIDGLIEQLQEIKAKNFDRVTLEVSGADWGGIFVAQCLVFEPEATHKARVKKERLARRRWQAEGRRKDWIVEKWAGVLGKRVQK